MRGAKQRGLNENLAREIMELHTLGVRTGYTQVDVTEFARALTGWTVAGIGRGPAARLVGGTPGEFQFAELIHEPGDRTIMGKHYRQDGEAQARAVLLDLAASPATAKHLSTKLARHFAGDDPPAPLIDRLTKAYLASGGDLPAVYRALINSPEVWSPQPLKFKNPWEWSVSALRAVGSRELEPMMAANVLRQLGQPTWQPGSPAGWDDIAASWAGPDALVRRVEVAQRMAAKARIDRRCSRARREALSRIAERADPHGYRASGEPGRGSRIASRQPGIREEMNMLTRRSFIHAGGAATALATLGFPRMAFARAAGDRRFVFIIQRGAADGLAIVAPTGDPQFASVRGDFAQDVAGGAKLGSFFTLHPALAETAKMYADRQALFVHAVASPYRDRSHFDGQNVLETGGSAAYRIKDGWMNRLLGLVPAADANALALSSTVPMALTRRA